MCTSQRLLLGTSARNIRKEREGVKERRRTNIDVPHASYYFATTAALNLKNIKNNPGLKIKAKSLIFIKVF